ncbi:FecR family protein [Spirosoma sp.]|uniref:FecR family protein n=1 Tax=Spirosoma sp. TaxID=1899569 RepID=UPI003B3AFB6D
MSRKEFGFLLKQYLDGKCTDEEKAFVEHWYGTLQQDEKSHVSETDFQALEPVLWQQIQSRTQVPKVIPMPVVEPRRSFGYVWMAAAASVVLMLTFGWWFYQQQQPKAFSGIPQEMRRDGWLQHTNTSTTSEAVRLADGSEVRLAPQSSIQYPAQFAADKREVLLEGEGFFTVEKMPTRPFYVYTGNVVTKVLGTSFLVKTQDVTKQVVVEVATGRVAVYKRPKASETDKATSEIVLTPNQKATYSSEKQQFVTGLVERPRVISDVKSEVKTRSFAFDDAPLRRVIDQLEEAYGITIQLENENQNDCPLTADLSNLSLYAQLDMICAATKSSYTVQGTSIVISGKGCANL